LQIYSGGEKTPALGLSKSYTVDFKEKITSKFFLRFRQLSASTGRFMPLSASGDASEPASKSTVIKPYRAWKTDAIVSAPAALIVAHRLP
jgi:hypothetical protein